MTPFTKSQRTSPATCLACGLHFLFPCSASSSALFQEAVLTNPVMQGPESSVWDKADQTRCLLGEKQRERAKFVSLSMAHCKMQIGSKGFGWRTSDSPGAISKHAPVCWPEKRTGLISLFHKISGAGGDKAAHLPDHKK